MMQLRLRSAEIHTGLPKPNANPRVDTAPFSLPFAAAQCPQTAFPSPGCSCAPTLNNSNSRSPQKPPSTPSSQGLF